MPDAFHKLIRKPWLTATLLLLILTAIMAPSAVAAERVLSEYQVQAAYLINFIRFTSWPPSAFRDEQQDIVIGILGEDVFGATFDAIDGRYIANRRLQVLRLREGDNAQGCHLLYISGSEGRVLKQILAGLHGKAILTVSDLDNFATAGGMIEIKKVDDKIQLLINVNVIRAAGLQLRANLLKIATLVGR